MYSIAASRSFFTAYSHMTSFGLGHHYISQLYQYKFSNTIIIIEEKVILKYSFMKSEVILSYFRHIQKTTLYFQKY